jgi:signal transduction histidine kinase
VAQLLIVDADRDLAVVLRDAFAAEGWTTELVDSVEAALGAATSAVVLARLPLLDLAVLREGQRRQPRWARVPVVALVEAGAEALTRPLGLAGELTAPFVAEEVVAHVRRAVIEGAPPESTGIPVEQPSEDLMGFYAFRLGALAERLPRLVSAVRQQARVLGRSPEIEALLGPAGEGADKALTFARWLRGLGGQRGARREPSDVRRLVSLAGQVVEPMLVGRARFERRFDAVPVVEVDERELVRVFIELLVNGALAIDPGEPDRHALVVSTSTDPRGNAVVVIEDTGRGIEPDLLPKIFDPLRSSRRGMGLGLGLVLCRDLLSAHHGELHLESVPGQGTRVTVLLPPATAPVTGVSSLRPGESPDRTRRLPS